MGLHVFSHHLRLIKLFQLLPGHVYPFRAVLRLFQQDFRQIVLLAAVLLAGRLSQDFAAETGNELLFLLVRGGFSPEGGVDGLGIGKSPADGLGIVQVVAVRNQLGTLHVVGEDLLIGVHDATALGQENLPFNNAAAGDSARFPGETSWRLTSVSISQMTAAPATPHRTRLLLANLDFVIVVMNGSAHLIACRGNAGGVFGRNVFYG